MLLPQSLSDVLASIEVLLPSTVEPGVLVTPRLTPSLDVLTALSEGATLARIDFGEVALQLTDAALDFTGLALDLVPTDGETLGETELETVLESVELPKPAAQTASAVDTTRQALREQRWPVPVPGSSVLGYALNDTVAGVIGKVSGGVTLASQVSGDAVGTLTGVLKGPLVADIKPPPLLDFVPKPSVQWRVEDAAGRPVQVALKNEGGLGALAPVFAFLPEFTELGDPELLTERRIWCDITVAKPDGTVVAQHTVGPIPIQVPKVPLPTLLLMSEHDLDGRPPGDLLVAVPESSPLDVRQIQAVANQLAQTRATVQRLVDLLDLGLVPTLEALDRIIAWIQGGQVTALKTNQVNELHGVVRDPGGFLGIGGTSWEDCVSGVFLFGPPGRSVTLHNRRNLWVGTGAIRVRVSDVALFAHLPSLRGRNPGAIPEGATAEVYGVDPVDDFNDVISSFAFEPL